MSERINTPRPSDANAITRRYLDSILVEQRLVDAAVPTLETEIFGEVFQTPIMTPAFSHLPVYGEGRENGLIEYSRAMKSLGGLNWVGMMENEAFEEVMHAGAKTVRIIKPYSDRAKIRDQIAFAENCGAFAVGIDIDHAFGSDGKNDIVIGEEMSPLSREELSQLVASTALPFVIKGVLSVQDALYCLECGVQGILVSHHHGRMPFAVPPLMVLPRIVKAVGGRMKIFVDCGMDTGADAFKALAMGADAVAVGRAMWEDLIRDGQAGLEAYIEKMQDELRMMLAFTGCRKPADAEMSMLWVDGKPLC